MALASSPKVVCSKEKAHSKSTESMNCWSRWRRLTYRFQTSGSPWHRTTTVCPRGDPVRTHCLWCNRNQKFWARPMTQGNEHLQVKMSGLKGCLCDPTGHTTASTTAFFSLFLSYFAYFLCFVWFWFFFQVWFYLGLEVARAEDGWQETGRLVGLELIMWNPQRINRRFFFSVYLYPSNAQDSEQDVFSLRIKIS